MILEEKIRVIVKVSKVKKGVLEFDIVFILISSFSSVIPKNPHNVIFRLQ